MKDAFTPLLVAGCFIVLILIFVLQIDEIRAREQREIQNRRSALAAEVQIERQQLKDKLHSEAESFEFAYEFGHTNLANHIQEDVFNAIALADHGNDPSNALLAVREACKELEDFKMSACGPEDPGFEAQQEASEQEQRMESQFLDETQFLQDALDLGHTDLVQHVVTAVKDAAAITKKGDDPTNALISLADAMSQLEGLKTNAYLPAQSIQIQVKFEERRLKQKYLQEAQYAVNIHQADAITARALAVADKGTNPTNALLEIRQASQELDLINSQF